MNIKMSEIANIGLHAFDVAKQFSKVQKLQYQSVCACVVRVESTCWKFFSSRSVGEASWHPDDSAVSSCPDRCSYIMCRSTLLVLDGRWTGCGANTRSWLIRDDWFTDVVSGWCCRRQRWIIMIHDYRRFTAATHMFTRTATCRSII